MVDTNKQKQTGDIRSILLGETDLSTEARTASEKVAKAINRLLTEISDKNHELLLIAVREALTSPKMSQEIKNELYHFLAKVKEALDHKLKELAERNEQENKKVLEKTKSAINEMKRSFGM